MSRETGGPRACDGEACWRAGVCVCLCAWSVAAGYRLKTGVKAPNSQTPPGSDSGVHRRGAPRRLPSASRSGVDRRGGWHILQGMLRGTQSGGVVAARELGRPDVCAHVPCLRPERGAWSWAWGDVCAVPGVPPFGPICSGPRANCCIAMGGLGAAMRTGERYRMREDVSGASWGVPHAP